MSTESKEERTRFWIAMVSGAAYLTCSGLLAYYWLGHFIDSRWLHILMTAGVAWVQISIYGIVLLVAVEESGLSWWLETKGKRWPFLQHADLFITAMPLMFFMFTVVAAEKVLNGVRRLIMGKEAYDDWWHEQRIAWTRRPRK